MAGSRRVVFGNRWLRVVAERFAPHPGAPPEDYFIVEVENWAVICPRAADGRFAMVEQYRPAVARTVLEFPAGTIDPGETPDGAIARELHEETGHRAVRLVALGTYFTDTGRLTNSAHLFYADVEAVADWSPEPGVAVRLVTADEIDRQIEAGVIATLHHVALWQLVKAKGLFPLSR